jgi:hypothetical protein
VQLIARKKFARETELPRDVPALRAVVRTAMAAFPD